MCDYSLMNIPNRLAKEGEDLVIYRFSNGCIGVASPSDLCPETNSPSAWLRTFWPTVKKCLNLETRSVAAVCIPPGASLCLTDIPKRLQRELGIGPTETVMFTQLTAAANTYRDAVRFSNGRTILLQGLHEGQRVRALALDPADKSDVSPQVLVFQDRWIS